MGFLSEPATETQVTHLRRGWLYLLTALAVVFLLAPTLLVVPMSFTASTFLEFPPREWSLRWYRSYFGTAEWREATWMSFKVASLTVLLATPLGTMAAYGLHVTRLRLAPLLMTLLVLPMLVPHILTAIGIFFVYVRVGLVNTTLGLVLAHTVLAIPFVVVVVTAGLRMFDMSTEMAARSLGASRLRAFLIVTLPQIRFSIVSGALLSFIASFDEVIVAFFVATGQVSTLTRRMFLALRDAIDPTIAAISTVLVVLSVVLLVLMQMFSSEARERR